MENYVPHLLRLHRNFLTRMLSLDAAYGAVGGLFLAAPLNTLSLSLDNLVLLVLGIMAALLYQIHLYRTYGGNAPFYWLLPVKRVVVVPVFVCFSFLPLGISIMASVGLKSIIGWDAEIAGIAYAQRIQYLLIVFAIMKSIPLPVFVLYKKHIAFVPAFFGALGIFYWVLSGIMESFSRYLSAPGIVTAALFAICVMGVSWAILHRTTIV